MQIKLTDIKDAKRGAYHKQFWFSWPEGKFMCAQAIAKPFYHYLSSPTAKDKRWRRIFQVELDVGAQVVRYICKGHKRAWVLYTIGEAGELVRQSSAQGVPPWMQRGN